MPSKPRAEVWALITDNETNGFYHSPKDPSKIEEIPAHKSIISIGCCGECILFRDRRGHQVAEGVKSCSCRGIRRQDRPHLAVDLKDRGPGSKLNKYRTKIIQNLKASEDILLGWYLESNQESVGQGNSEIAQVGIQVARKNKNNKFVKGTYVTGIHFGDFTSCYASQEHIKELDRWKQRKVRDVSKDVAIGFSFHFYMHCSKIQVQFWVLMGFKLEQKWVQEWKQRPVDTRTFGDRITEAFSNIPTGGGKVIPSIMDARTGRDPQVTANFDKSWYHEYQNPSVGGDSWYYPRGD